MDIGTIDKELKEHGNLVSSWDPSLIVSTNQEILQHTEERTSDRAYISRMQVDITSIEK